MQNLLTKFACAVFLLTSCFYSDVFAQNQKTRTYYPRKLEFDSYVNAVINDSGRDTLFQTFSYVAPYDNRFESLTVSKEGRIAVRRIVVGWAKQGENETDLNQDRADKFVSLIKNLRIQEQKANITPKENEKHTVFVYLQDGEYKRVDYLGELPFEVKELIDFAQSELEENSTFILEIERAKELRKKTIQEESYKRDVKIDD